MFPDGYATNLARGASLEKMKIFVLKSHDWHIWLERIMPVMLRSYIPEDEWLVMAELSYFCWDTGHKTQNFHTYVIRTQDLCYGDVK